ncbi:AraC family transcriptional regulator [Kineococcus indalonis]|uniref:AraC family transcriptional regulator n=1 Tax=Kineococcus indalonis TaxID=2696566 RepID=UPI0014124D07|nr:AraC family transcriptional regulator [Kineococcus indalonis]NAZ85723.1 helix-turn-helix domain-containing protein [Kineococcus indalonis]
MDASSSSPRPRRAARAPLRAVREVVPAEPGRSARWHVHDYPSPFARWNHHPEYEVHLIRAGTGRYIIGDSIGLFSTGHLALVGTEVPHDWISDLGPGQVITGRDVVFQFHGDWLRRCEQVLPELADLAPLWAAAAGGIEFLGRTALAGAAELERIGSTSGARRLQHIFTLFDLMAGAPEDERRLIGGIWQAPAGDPETAEVVSAALAYVVDHLTGTVRLSTAAQRAGMSESAFSRRFKRATGMTFTDVVRKLRLAHAAKLLAQTSQPVASIAAAVGYANLSNFNRQFRAEHGSTPTRYRVAARTERAGASSS